MIKSRYGKPIMIVALALSMLFTTVALADVTTSATVKGETLSLGCGFGVDESAMTAEQQTTRVDAVSQYYAAEDDVLAGLAEAGTAAQADVDAYKLGRDARWLLTQMDKAGWTDEQTKAYAEAAALSGDARDTAADALVTSGQLTSEQGAALKVSGTNTSRSINLSDTSAVETATNDLEALRQTLKQTLTDAGITVVETGSGGNANRTDGDDSRRQNTGGKSL